MPEAIAKASRWRHERSEFFIVFGFIFSLMFPMMGIFEGFVVRELLFVPVIFLGGMIFFKKNTENRLLKRIKEFEEKVNLHI
ncbi:hypothetical protein K0040_02220 [Terrisporobacter petrolearius]|uniref:hypothetical protein n=2 Tax=Terrisporobacter petrolearius TaxID=1460447 RepID=UPI001D167FD1|nr:hypothetical protein [Terrisporobacter petrolearius]MCC3863131.1 hypothetical protein [Terrisporobacter petrolearius]